MKTLRIILLVLTLATVWWPAIPVQADGSGCSQDPDGSITCVQTGGNACSGCGADGGAGPASGGNSSTPTAPTTDCTPGATMQVQRYIPNESGSCSMYTAIVDQCSGSMLDMGDDLREDIACPETASPPVLGCPCQSLSVSQSGITCNGQGLNWTVRARVLFPETYLDVRPFPATLVRWPTAVRNGGQAASSGSGSVGYVSNGGGSPGNPAVGDWSNLILKLTLDPAGPMRVSLPHIGTLNLPDQGATGTPTLFQWEVPSHPEAGGGPLAGNISGLEELPGDLPLFVGSARSPYRLFWELSYNQYEAIQDCVPGPNLNGRFNCGGGTGHKEVVGYAWRRHSSGGEIHPNEVAGLPAQLAADLNGDGIPEAYWDLNLALRRMDDTGSVDNPTYRRAWNWGGAIYWGVREGQGQIGWPGGQ